VFSLITEFALARFIAPTKHDSRLISAEFCSSACFARGNAPKERAEAAITRPIRVSSVYDRLRWQRGRGARQESRGRWLKSNANVAAEFVNYEIADGTDRECVREEIAKRHVDCARTRDNSPMSVIFVISACF